MKNGEPTVWGEYINQDNAKRVIRVAIDAAKGRDERLDHTLIYGPSGIGKTALARLVAGDDMRIVYGQNLVVKDVMPGIKEAVVASRFRVNFRIGAKSEAQTAFLFIDEVHMVPKDMQEEALELLDNKTMTVIASTTRPDMLIAPLRRRFQIQLRLDFYDGEHIAKIIRMFSNHLGIEASDEAIQVLASRSRGIPSVGKMLLRRVRDYGDELDVHVVNEGLAMIGIDEWGLDTDERNYMLALAFYNGGPVAVSTLAANLSIDTKVLSTTEVYPLRSGLVEITSKGRLLTDDGEKYIRRITV